MEVFNEMTVLICSWHLLIFSDLITDADIQYMAGWSLVLITISNLLINIGIVLFTSLADLKRKLCRYC